MSYLSTGTKVVSLTIGGQDYTQNLSNWAVSDASAYKNGCISTTGSLTLSTVPGGPSLEDYDRDTFSRGAPVILDLSYAGSTFRHPRGYLYVVSCSYDVESETLSVDLTCKLGMMSLLDNFDDLKSRVPVTLDVVQDSYEGCCAAFASVGQYIYQDNQSNLVSGLYFDGERIGYNPPGSWVSVLGVTARSVSPLQASGPIPDIVNLSYQVPLDLESVDQEDQTGRVDTVETTSYYFLSYPSSNYIRQNTNATVDNPNGTLENIGSITPQQPTTGSSSSCGNFPSRPGGNGNGGTACNLGYKLVQSPIFLPAIREQEDTSTYEGPGGQQSSSISILRGPRLESNPQYFSDAFSYCRQTWGSLCNPNGSCPYEGLDNIVLSRTETTNFFGEGGEVVRKVTDNYVTKLSAAQPADWRAGNNSGNLQYFDPSYKENSELFRVSRVEEYYSIQNNVNIQETIRYDSVTSRGTGITGGQNLDALAGVQTRTVRKSSSTATVAEQPDSVNSPTVSTESKNVKLRVGINSGNALYGDYTVDEQVPLPLLFNSESAIEDAVNKYSDYIVRFIKGDALGFQVGESLRPEIIASWAPNMSFRYYDPKKGKLIAARMDATTWGVNPQESAFVTNGIWTAFTNGTVTIPSNVTGNSIPDMSAPSDGVNPNI